MHDTHRRSVGEETTQPSRGAAFPGFGYLPSHVARTFMDRARRLAGRRTRTTPGLERTSRALVPKRPGERCRAVIDKRPGRDQRVPPGQ
jgi:hypothetical protein